MLRLHVYLPEHDLVVFPLQASLSVALQMPTRKRKPLSEAELEQRRQKRQEAAAKRAKLQEEAKKKQQEQKHRKK